MSSPASLHAERPALRLGTVPRLTMLGAMLVVLLVIAAQLGAVPIAGSDWLRTPWSTDAATGGSYVLWQLRLPRLLLSVGVGAALGLAGALSQSLFRNPMADPGLLGVTSGAAAAVALTLTFFTGLQLALPAEARLWVLPLVGFVGALGVCFALENLARWLAPGSIAALLLSGLAIQALTFAVVGLCSFLATDDQLRAINFWTLGSLAGANWAMALTTVVVLIAMAAVARRLAPKLNALALGEAVASHLGVDVQRLRGVAVAIVALLSAIAVAWCGSISFIGLMAPHLARQLVGADARQVVPASMLCGSLLLVAADTAARTLALPAEIPVGIFSALIGAPWFLFLLRGALRRMGTA